jgi:hypothetical protein
MQNILNEESGICLKQLRELTKRSIFQAKIQNRNLLNHIPDVLSRDNYAAK